MYKSRHPGRRNGISVADLIEEVEEQFHQVMDAFNKTRRNGDPLRYNRRSTGEYIVSTKQETGAQLYTEH